MTRLAKSLRQTDAQLFLLGVFMLLLSTTFFGLTLFFQVHPITHVSISQTPYPIGHVINQGRATMRLNSVSFSAGGGPFQSPASKHYAVLDFTVKNNSDQPITVLPTTDTYVKDDLGNVVYLTPFALDSPFHAGELPPGEVVRGQLSFIVPKSGHEQFYVDAIWSGGVIPFILQ